MIKIIIVWRLVTIHCFTASGSIERFVCYCITEKVAAQSQLSNHIPPPPPALPHDFLTSIYSG